MLENKKITQTTPHHWAVVALSFAPLFMPSPSHRVPTSASSGELVTPQPVTSSQIIFIELFHTVNTRMMLLYADLLTKNEFLGNL